jgi:chaperonin GroEL (HSP60 family)
MDLKRGLDRASKAAIGALREMSREVGTRKEKAQVATISAHNDAGIGELVADAMEKVGGEGVITAEEIKDHGNDVGSGRRYAVRPRLHLALLRHQSRQDGR